MLNRSASGDASGRARWKSAARGSAGARVQSILFNPMSSVKQMKFNLAVATALLGSLGLSGCMGLDEQIVSGVTASYYETAEGVEDAVDAAYSGLQDLYGQERNMTMLEYGTDIWTKGADGSHKQWNDYTAQLEPRTSYAREQWQNTYRTINTVNAVIARAPEAATTSSFTTAVKAQRIAEARFLRAFYYFYLVRHYGDVTISLDETQGVVTEAKRSPKEQVYTEVIIPDLQAAIEALPATQSDFGRATKGAAQHLLALVYLTQHAPDVPAADAAKAEALLRQVVAGPYALLPRYVNLFCGSRSAEVNCTPISNEDNSEVIFSVQYTDDLLTTGQGDRWHLYWLMEYDTQPAMKRSIEYGRPFKRLRLTEYGLYLWDRSMDSRYEDSFQHVWIANKGDKARGIEIGDTAIFLPGVKTKDLPAVYKGKPYTVITEPDDFWHPKRVNPAGSQYPNVKSEYSTNLFPALAKFQDPTRLSTNQEQGQRDVVVYRLADTYLMLAESLIRQGKTAEAVEWVNKVRRRAALPGHQTDMEVGVDKMNLDFILEERARELFGEGHRWFDLVRFGKLIENVKKYNMDAAPNIQPFHVLRPIPQDQIDRTHNEDGTPYGQNPGY